MDSGIQKVRGGGGGAKRIGEGRVTCLNHGYSVGGRVKMESWTQKVGGGGFSGAKCIGEGRVQRLFCIQELVHRNIGFSPMLHNHPIFNERDRRCLCTRKLIMNF